MSDDRKIFINEYEKLCKKYKMCVGSFYVEFCHLCEVKIYKATDIEIEEHISSLKE